MLDKCSIQGATALVTGGAKRLGAATTLSLADAGVHVVIHYNTSPAEAQQVQGQAQERGVNAFLVQAELGSPEGVARAFTAAEQQAGPIDILINNASIFPESGLHDCSVPEIEENIRINAIAPFLLSRAFAAQQRPGCIINLLDTMILDYDRKHVPYHLSKRLLHSLTRIMAVEFAPDIRVNAVAPGLVLPPEGKDERYLAGLAHSNPLRCYGDCTDVTSAILFLLRSRFVTGQTIFVDGGRHLKGKMYD